jgi:hypothetical protein
LDKKSEENLKEKKRLNSIKDNLRSENKRLISIGERVKKQLSEIDTMKSNLNIEINSTRTKNKELEEIKKQAENKAVELDCMLGEVELAKKSYDQALNALGFKEKEIEIKRLQLIKLSKEKITEEKLKELEKFNT